MLKCNDEVVWRHHNANATGDLTIPCNMADVAKLVGKVSACHNDVTHAVHHQLHASVKTQSLSLLHANVSTKVQHARWVKTWWHGGKGMVSKDIPHFDCKLMWMEQQQHAADAQCLSTTQAMPITQAMPTVQNVDWG